MATNIGQLTIGHRQLSLLRFCGPEREGPDRVRVRVLAGPWSLTMTREEWEQLSQAVQGAFDELPVSG